MRRNGRLLYYCYDHNRPSGGQKHTYEHVDILNQAGYRAVVVHSQPDFRLTWFENQTPVACLAEVETSFDAQRDMWVLPEDLGPRIDLFPGKKVIFNKNLYHGFAAFGPGVPARYPYVSDDVVAVLAVSEHNASHLRFAYTRTPVFRVFASIRSDLFRYRLWREKRRRIATIGKASAQLLAVYHMLMSRAAAGLNQAASFEWLFVHNKSEAETANLLGESVATVFTSIDEGLPRFVLESLLSGCLTIAFNAGPLREALPAYSRFAPGDGIAAVRFLEAIISAFPHDACRFEQCTLDGLEIARQFTRDRQVESVLAAWHEIDRLQGTTSDTNRAISIGTQS